MTITITYIILGCIFSVLLFILYRKNKPLYAYVLAVFILIDTIIRLSTFFINIPTIVKSLSSGLVDVDFIVFLFYWAKEADVVFKDTDDIRVKKRK